MSGIALAGAAGILVGSPLADVAANDSNGVTGTSDPSAVYKASSTSSSQGTGLSTGTDGFIRYNHPVGGINGKTSSLIEGKHESDGSCSFSGKLELSPGQDALVQEVEAFNPATCEKKVVTGTPTRSYLDAISAPDAVERDSGSGVPTPSSSKSMLRSSSAPLSGNTFESEGYLSIYYVDPIYLTVNSVENGTKWDWNGDYVVGKLGGVGVPPAE